MSAGDADEAEGESRLGRRLSQPEAFEIDPRVQGCDPCLIHLDLRGPTTGGLPFEQLLMHAQGLDELLVNLYAVGVRRAQVRLGPVQSDGEIPQGREIEQAPLQHEL